MSYCFLSLLMPVERVLIFFLMAILCRVTYMEANNYSLFLSRSFSCFSLFAECSGVSMNLLLAMLTITVGQVGMSPSSHEHSALILRLLGALGSKLRLWQKMPTDVCNWERETRFVDGDRKTCWSDWSGWKRSLENDCPLNLGIIFTSFQDGILNMISGSIGNDFQGLAPDICRSGATAVMAPFVLQNRPSIKHRTHPKSGWYDWYDYVALVIGDLTFSISAGWTERNPNAILSIRRSNKHSTKHMGMRFPAI